MHHDPPAFMRQSIERITCFVIVARINQHIARERVSGIKPPCHNRHGHACIHGFKPPCQHNGFGTANICLGKLHLTLKIGPVHNIIINNLDFANAGCGEIHGTRPAQRACTDNRNRRPRKPGHTRPANFFEEDVPFVALEV